MKIFPAKIRLWKDHFSQVLEFSTNDDSTEVLDKVVEYVNIESLWNNAIDPPTDIRRPILFFTNKGHFGLIILRNGSYWFEYKPFDSWKEFLENYKVERWCYADEII